jgi:SAM-dependent methyltransferase
MDARHPLHDYYERGEEQDRLVEPFGQVEYLRTLDVLAEHLPPAPAVVADVGGGPGRYALELARQGYDVVHRDVVPLHVEQLRGADTRGLAGRVDTAVGDARSVDLADGSVDAVLLLGPLYHLEDRADRVRALAEARRVGRPGAVVIAAAISRWAARLHAVMTERLYLALPRVLDILAEVGEPEGNLPPLHPASFTCHTHRPEELRSEAVDAGLVVGDLVGLEGHTFALPDLAERLADDLDREVLLDSLRRIQRVPELLGLSPHLLVVARVP